jgi:isoleucyl-tRNA synthetase
LWNSFSFFSTYANADEITFKDLEKALPVEERAMMDRWIISSLQSLIKTVNEKMENYYLYEVIPPLMNFVEELTNWYVRSNRKRFWKEKDGNDIDKINAFKTLHEVLTEFTKSMAPVLPFICEKIYQGLNDEENGSVHYENYPVSNKNLIDLELEDDIELAKKVIKSVRNLRVKLKLPNKQPLNSVKIVTNDKKIEKRLFNISELIKNEINVKNVDFDVEISEWVDYIFKPDYKKLGPKLGKKIGNIANKLKNLSPEDAERILDFEAITVDGIELQNEDIEIQLKPKKDLLNQDIVDDFLIYLDTDLNDELLMERFSREVVSNIQQTRKDTGLDVTDRIKLKIFTKDTFVMQSIKKHESYIMNETLSLDLVLTEKSGENEIHNKKIDILINKLTDDS